MIVLSGLDKLIVVGYFIAIFSIAIWSKVKESRANSDAGQDYFLAGRNLGWFVIGASLFASNIGSEHLVGLAGAGASSGVAVAQFEILAGFILLLLGWVFVPFYIRSGVVTMPEFLEVRYSKGARFYLSLISIIAYVITKISVTIFAGAIIFETIGVPFWAGATIIVVATGIYTVFGGLRAVLYTDMVQMFIMLFGSTLVTILGIQAAGGWSEISATVGPEFLSMWRTSDHPDFPWTGIIFGAPILGVWYWCTDQFIVQRVLSARNISQARKGTIFGGFLKMLPLFIFVFPGIICYVLVQQGALELPNPDQALPTLVSFVLPSGLKGVVIAGLLAALMSSLSSVFNSCSTLFTYDFYLKYNPKASDKKLVFVGQIATVILVLLGVAWIPLMDFVSGGLFKYIQSVQAYISPPIAAVFLLGIFFKRLNAQGAMASLWTGFVLGIGRLVAEIFKDGAPALIKSYAEINFLHFAFFLFVVCSTVLIVTSLMTKEPDYARISKVTYNKDIDQSDDPNRKSDFILSLVLIGLIGTLWIVFS